jgi:hypothetical protein
VVKPLGAAPRARRAAALLLALAAPAAAGPAECKFSGAPRVVAVGDVHGAYERFAAILHSAGIVDENGRWSGGRAQLVQTGDVLDRGTDTRRCLDLLMRLEGEAKKAGGQVHALLGNHEAMNIVGDLRYVKPAEYELFRTPRSEEHRHHLYERSLAGARDAAKQRAEKFDEDAFRKRFDAQAPLGFVERTQALSAEGTYGRWLRERPATVVVNGVAFVHGGLTPESAALGCDGINAAVQRELGPDLAKTRQDPTAALATGEQGPLWYRGLARADETALSASLDEALRKIGAHAVVIGHTVTSTGRIETRFGGRVVMIDAGMTDEYGGHAAALEIDSEGRMTAVYPGEREPLAVPAARAARSGAGGLPLQKPALRPTFRSSQPQTNQGGAR